MSPNEHGLQTVAWKEEYSQVCSLIKSSTEITQKEYMEKCMAFPDQIHFSMTGG